MITCTNTPAKYCRSTLYTTTQSSSLLLLLSVILFVADFFHPVNNLPVESLLNGEMRHRDCRAGAMPVLLIGFEPDNIAWSDLFDGASPPLHPPDA